MSKLLRRAKVKLENAKNSYRYISDDDAYLDDCCYNLQQSIEMSLKFLVELCGQKYIQNHDIRAQLNILRNYELDIPEVDTLRSMASVINSWESESRYMDSFLSAIEDVDRVMKLSEDLISYIDSLTTEVNLSEAEPQTDLDDDLEL